MIAYLLLNGGNGNTASVPSVVGQTQAQAVKAVKQAGLTPMVVKVPSSDKIGIVVSSNPQFGTKVAPHSNVTLDVSAGPKKVTIPNVVGESENTAQSQLQSLGLNVTTKTAPNSTLPQGKVVRTDPPVGTLVKQGSTVMLFVSGGGTQVPSVIGDPKATAESILSNAGFKVTGGDDGRPGRLDPGHRVPAAAEQRHHRGGRLHGDHLRGRGHPADVRTDQRLAHPDRALDAHADPERDQPGRRRERRPERTRR